MNKLFFCLFILFSVVTLPVALASETLYYLVAKAEWQANDNKAGHYLLPLSKEGYIQLLPREQVVQAAQALFQGRSDLLLLKIEIPFTDSLLRWENLPGHEVSFPRYYGALDRSLVRKVYAFKPKRNGQFALPNDPFLKRVVARVMPKTTINRFLDYQEWQKTGRLYKLQEHNFGSPKVQLQWWYFDFFLADGSSVVLAFIPQGWWDKVTAETDKKSMFTMALKTKDGVVKRFTTVIPQSEIRSTKDRLEIPSRLVIESIGVNTDRHFSIRVNFPEIIGVFNMAPTRPPFAAFPTGAMPGMLMTLMSGADWGSPRFSYVSQIPSSTVSGSLNWDDYREASLSGQGYHEQGRLDDTPERQGGSWTWYHFSGEGWSIFGSPGSYIYLQYGDQVLRSGFHLMSKEYTLKNRTFSSPDHAKILTGGEISFRHDDITFQIKISPATAKTLVCYASPAKPTEVWGTVGGIATLSISEGTKTKTVQGRMFLETCSWETRIGR